MSKNFRNYIIDMAILATGVLCGITGIIKWPGLAASLGLSYQSLPMEPLTLIHDWSGLFMCIFAILHVIMHLKWLASMTKKFLVVNGVKNEKA
jgi:hypothetical protein